MYRRLYVCMYAHLYTVMQWVQNVYPIEISWYTVFPD